MKFLSVIRLIRCPVYFLVCWIAYGAAANSQTITIDTPLSFGRFVMVDNTAPRAINLLPNGGFTADAQYIFFTNPQMGTVIVDDFPSSSTLNVSVGLANLNNGGGLASFSTASTFTNPATVTTDNTGSATFDVGTTLLSDGGGSTHIDGKYNGVFTITVTP